MDSKMHRECSEESCEAVIEVKSSEVTRDHVGRGSAEVGENLFVSVASDILIDVRSGESNCSSAENMGVIPHAKPGVSEDSSLIGRAAKADPARDAFVVLNVKKACGTLNSGSWDSEKVCRICHLTSDSRLEGSELIHLGCGCKDELGAAHRHCAEAWFKLKSNRLCEICGEIAKNVTGLGDQRFIEEWNDTRVSGREVSSSSSERRRCWRGQPFCNFLMGCLVIAFILPWFFRINMF